MHQIRQLAHISACLLVAAATLSAAGEQLSFTRPTIGAALTTAPSSGRKVLLDDEPYVFVTDSGRLLVYSKPQQRWLWIETVTTEHGRFGEAPPVVQLGWNDADLINRDFTSVPLAGHRLPDRIVASAADGTYRMDFGVRFGVENAVTSFWFSSKDIEAAFRGERAPAAPPPNGGNSGIQASTDVTLMAAFRINGRAGLFCSVESGVLATLEYGVPYPSSRQADLSIGEMTLRGVTIAAAPDSKPGQLPVKGRYGIAGVIGADLFGQSTVLVDYDHGTVNVLAPTAFSGRDAGDEIRADWRRRVPVVRARIALADGRSIVARLVVDTGTAEPVVLRPSFAAAQRLVDTTRVETLSLGGYALRDMPVTVRPTSSDRVVDADGTIGSGVLRRFRVAFDRAHNRLFLRPGALFTIPYDYDASGLRIVANGGEFGVGNIVGGYASPPGIITVGDASAEARFQIGDVIVEFDGRSFAGVTLDAVRSAFKADAHRHTIVVRRHGALRTITYDAPSWLR